MFHTPQPITVYKPAPKHLWASLLHYYKRLAMDLSIPKPCPSIAPWSWQLQYVPGPVLLHTGVSVLVIHGTCGFNRSATALRTASEWNGSRLLIVGILWIVATEHSYLRGMMIIENVAGGSGGSGLLGSDRLSPYSSIGFMLLCIHPFIYLA